MFNRISLLLIFLQLRNTLTEWQLPPFFDTNTTGVVFQNKLPNYQVINVKEELKWPFYLTKINYKGLGTPTIGAFDTGDNSLLGAAVIKRNNDWIISIQKRQDYENPNQRIYIFSVYIKGSGQDNDQHSILVSVENVFDNNVTITYYPSPCIAEELQSNYVTNCTLLVYDPDGMENNIIRIEIVGQNNEEKLFDFVEDGPLKPYEKEFKLRLKMQLHYEESAIYNIHVTGYDRQNNSGSIWTILEVIDMPNRDPVWIKPLATATFNEKEEQFFTIKAIDGDTGIDTLICYRLEFETNYSHLMSINKDTGELHIQPIDRDALDQQIFSFYTCAFKCNNSTWAIRETTILIVQDINDNLPKIDVKPDSVQILESTFLTLPLQKFIVNDVDLGINATYNISLYKDDQIDYSESFDLIPNSGYKEANFRITVANSNPLDYEVLAWRSFSLKIIAQEVETLNHVSTKKINVDLINWNDERPIFQEEIYITEVLENITMDKFLKQVLAIDRDLDDFVVHSIVGNFAGIRIDPKTGIVTTTQNDVFDYDRQQVVMIQIRAQDTLTTDYTNVLHTEFTQLKINVIDVNNITPELRLPRKLVNITENSPGYTLLTDHIEGRDPDTKANLSFNILWKDSYATKGGLEAERIFYENCLILEVHQISQNFIYGHLKVNPAFLLNYNIDFEKYDTIYLSLKITDQNQEINDNSSIGVLTIRVDDLNDNAPNFLLGTLAEPRKITEEEDLQTIIGTIEAFDIDGPGNNIITYKIRSGDGLSRDGLVLINNATGVLRVSGQIQCDIPKIYNLIYEIILTDNEHTTTGTIKISVNDINNRKPQIDLFTQQVKILENAKSGYIVGQIKAHDDDRDEPHNVLEYSINSAIYSDLHNLFQINISNGLIVVNLRNGAVLDRDNGIEYYNIVIDIKDNFNYIFPEYGPVNQNQTFINITLLDVNDNAPLMPPKNMFAPEFSESDQKGSYSKAQIVAKDKDEPNTPNSFVSYKINNIKPVSENMESVQVKDYNDLFTIEGDDKVYGQVVVLKNLTGYYGIWEIEIEAYDHGDPVMRNLSSYNVSVRPYNYHSPVIVFPQENRPLRICHAMQEPNRPLYQADCNSNIKQFEANDPDGGEYGDVTFLLTSDNGDDKYFIIKKEDRKKSTLHVVNPVPAGIYYINVRAIDGGGFSTEEVRNLKIIFVEQLGNPVFLEKKFTTNFTENEEGLGEVRYIPKAFDPKNEGIDDEDEKYEIFYFIDDTYSPNYSKLFTLDKKIRSLKLTTTLDRENTDKYTIMVKATNDEDGVIKNPNSVNFTLEVLITVNDINDNPPRFNQTNYAAGITTKDPIEKRLLVFYALDPDLDDDTTYVIKEGSMRTQGENIDQYKDNMFNIDNITGVLTLTSYVTYNMKGFFMFDIVAYDTAIPPHNDIVPTKIYIVAEENRVKFVFLSTLQTIHNKEKYIREEFQDQYGYEICNIDTIEDATNQQPSRAFTDTSHSAPITDVIVHFIHNNQAVEASGIQRRSNDLAFVSKLTNSLQRYNLILNDVPHSKFNVVQQDFNDLLTTTLIVISVLLTTLCVVLVVAFVMKTRALNRQLKAFDPPDFGSTASNLNRSGVPTTNIFSIEGSNPVNNNKPSSVNNNRVFDEESSEESDEESDFGCLYDDPTFFTDVKDAKYAMNFSKRPSEIGNKIVIQNFNAKDEGITKREQQERNKNMSKY